jgi:hypothetical protein
VIPDAIEYELVVIERRVLRFVDPHYRLVSESERRYCSAAPGLDR